MKNIFKYLALLGVSFVMVSCAKEYLNSEGTYSEFVVSVPETENILKTALGGKSGNSYPVTWVAGDRICINGTLSDAITSGGTKKAVFTYGAASFVPPYNVTYPGVENKDNVAVFASLVNPSALVLPMYASGYSNKFVLSHLAGVLKLSLAAETSTKITSISLQSLGNETISGNINIVKEDGKLTGEFSDGGSTSLSVNCGSGYTLTSTPVEIMIPVPARTYSKGIQVQLTASNTDVMTFKVMDATQKTVEPGKVIEFNTVFFMKDSAQEDIFAIKDYQTLKQFKNAVNDGDVTLKGIVTANFTLTSGQAAEWTEIEDYCGTLDGNGKTITGLTSPLFNNLYGTVRNLTLNSTIVGEGGSLEWGIFARTVSTDTRVDDIGGLINCIAQGSLTWSAKADEDDNTHCIGGLVGTVRGTMLDGCANYASVQFTGDVASEQQLYLGGVYGRGAQDDLYKFGSAVTGCTNYGAVTFNASVTIYNAAYVGGVCGYDVYGVCDISDCTNRGPVTAGASGKTKNIYFGGVAGQVGGSASNLYNYGEVKVLEGFSNSNSGHIYQGGVVGVIRGATKEIENLKNYAGANVISEACYCHTMYIGGVVGENRSKINRHYLNEAEVKVDGAMAYNFIVGGVVACDYTENSSYTDCQTSSSAKVTVTSNTYIRNASIVNQPYGVCAGGLIGRSNNYTQISDCSSAAVISIDGFSIDGGSTLKPNNIGGIIGWLENSDASHSTTFDSVSNTGDITIGSNFALRYSSLSNFGGLVGYAVSDESGSFEMTDSFNTGNINLTTSSNVSKGQEIGGLIGNLNMADYTQSGSYNTGNITISGTNMGSKTEGFYGLHVGGNVGLVYHGDKGESHVEITGMGENTPVNSGNVSYDISSTWCAYRPVYGGVIAVACGNGESKPLYLTLEDAANVGDANMSYTSTIPGTTNYKYIYSYAYAGGILGFAGGVFDTSEDDDPNDYSYSNITLSGCVNSGELKWGLIHSGVYADGKSSYTSNYTNFTGGIVGVIRGLDSEWCTTIESCVNKGDVHPYIGCAGGIAGAIKDAAVITGADGAYTENRAVVMKDSGVPSNKPQGFAGGLCGWALNTDVSAIFVDHFKQTGTVYANAGVGGAFGRLGGSGQLGDFSYCILGGEVRSSTSTGNSGMFSGSSPQGATDFKNRCYPNVSYVAVGGKLNGKNSGATTVTFNSSDFADQMTTCFSVYKSETSFNPTTAQVSSMHLEYWDGSSSPSWE